jgi:hypothetical protein
VSAATAIRARAASLASDASRRTITRLVQSGRIPRVAFQHYFIESEGLHSRIMLQNYWSTFWPNVTETVTARIDVYAPDGKKIGHDERALPPFGSLFLEARDLLERIGSGVHEGSVTIDLEPPAEAARELGAFPLAEPWGLRISTPFWMAYYDADENYMYVHSIDRHAGEFYGVPAPVGWLLSRRFGVVGKSWRGGRLLDPANLNELQIVALNHGSHARTADVGIVDAETDEPIWMETQSFAPHALARLKVPTDVVSAHGRQVRLAVDPLPTLNGKPYVLMRYGTGPLSLHHG